MTIRLGAVGAGVTIIYRPLWDPPSIEVQVSLSGVGGAWSFPMEDLIKLFDNETVDSLAALRQAIDERLAALDA